MEAPPTGASRFSVVFGRSTGSRKQRAKREGSLSVGYHTATLFDVEEKTCAMVCKGTGVMPNVIFARMQRARRGADWVVGTELTLNGYDIVIEEVMELHLIPYHEAVPSASTAAAAATPNRVPTAPLTPPESNDTWPGRDSATATPMKAFQRHRAEALFPSVKPTAAAVAVVVPQRQDAPPAVRMALLPAELRKAESEAANSRESENQTLAYDDDIAAAAVAVEQSRYSESETAPKRGTQRRRRRRSPSSVARELRNSYPQYF